MSLPRSFLLISSNLNSTWCLYLNEENVSQAFRHAEMESTILLQQQTSSNVDTWSKIKSINILLLQGTFTAVSCRVRLCKFQVIKRPGREGILPVRWYPFKSPKAESHFHYSPYFFLGAFARDSHDRCSPLASGGAFFLA